MSGINCRFFMMEEQIGLCSSLNVVKNENL